MRASHHLDALNYWPHHTLPPRIESGVASGKQHRGLTVYVDCTAKGLDGRMERLQKSGETLVSKALVITDRCASPIHSSAVSVRSHR